MITDKETLDISPFFYWSKNGVTINKENTIYDRLLLSKYDSIIEPVDLQFDIHNSANGKTKSSIMKPVSRKQYVNQIIILSLSDEDKKWFEREMPTIRYGKEIRPHHNMILSPPKNMEPTENSLVKRLKTVGGNKNKKHFYSR